MWSKLKSKRLKDVQLSWFFLFCCFKMRVHLRWLSFVWEKRTLVGELQWVRCHRACMSACDPSTDPFSQCPVLPYGYPLWPWHAMQVNGSWRTRLRTSQAFAWGHFSAFLLQNSILSSPVTVAMLSIDRHAASASNIPSWKNAYPWYKLFVTSMVWQRAGGCEVHALLSGCIWLWQISEPGFQVFCPYCCIYTWLRFQDFFCNIMESQSFIFCLNSLLCNLMTLGCEVISLSNL